MNIINLFAKHKAQYLDESPHARSRGNPNSVEGGDVKKEPGAPDKKYAPGDIVRDKYGNYLKILEPASLPANIHDFVYEAQPLGDHPQKYVELIVINENDIVEEVEDRSSDRKYRVDPADQKSPPEFAYHSPEYYTRKRPDKEETPEPFKEGQDYA